MKKEIIVNDSKDRNNVVVALANAGYLVSVRERVMSPLKTEHIVVYYEKETHCVSQAAADFLEDKGE